MLEIFKAYGLPTNRCYADPVRPASCDAGYECLTEDKIYGHPPLGRVAIFAGAISLSWEGPAGQIFYVGGLRRRLLHKNLESFPYTRKPLAF